MPIPDVAAGWDSPRPFGKGEPDRLKKSDVNDADIGKDVYHANDRK
jgi:hypothetical protein